MAKVSIKSEKITPFGGKFHVREHFSRFVGPVIDKVLGFGAHRSAIKARDCGFFVKCLHLWRRLCGGTMASDGQGCQSPSWQREVAVVGIDSFKNRY